MIAHEIIEKPIRINKTNFTTSPVTAKIPKADTSKIVEINLVKNIPYGCLSQYDFCRNDEESAADAVITGFRSEPEKFPRRIPYVHLHGGAS